MERKFMKRALQLAVKGAGRAGPNPLVGAVLVKDGVIIGEGWHKAFGLAHAEVNAVLDAERANKNPEGSELYVTLEPCCHYGKTPPCTELLIHRKVKRVIIGCLDPNPLVSGKGVKKLMEAGVEVTVGLLQEECRKANEIFFHFVEKKRPFVVVKTAVSLDGKIATGTGESKWITGEAARENVQRLRNDYAAIMTGVTTVIRDDPELTCRWKGGINPRRIILDSKLRTPLHSRILKDQAENQTIVACCKDAPEQAEEKLKALGAAVLRCDGRNGRVDLEQLIRKLGELSLDSILVEAGGTVNETLFRYRLADKLILYLAPKIIGGSNALTFVEGKGIFSLDQAYPMQIDSIDKVGDDVRITAYRKEG